MCALIFHNTGDITDAYLMAHLFLVLYYPFEEHFHFLQWTYFVSI